MADEILNIGPIRNSDPREIVERMEAIADRASVPDQCRDCVLVALGCASICAMELVAEHTGASPSDDSEIRQTEQDIKNLYHECHGSDHDLPMRRLPNGALTYMCNSPLIYGES